MTVIVDRLQLRKELCEVLISNYVALLGQRGSGSKTLAELITAKESPLPGLRFVAVALPQSEKNSDLFMKRFLDNLIDASTQIAPQPDLSNRVKTVVSENCDFPAISLVRKVLDILGKYSSTSYLIIVLHDLASISEQPLKDLLLLFREYHRQIGMLNLSGEKLRFLVIGGDRLWRLCCHKPSDLESPFNIAQRVFINGLSYLEIQEKNEEIDIEQAMKLRDLADGIPSLVELLSQEPEEFEDLSGCFGPLEDRWNSLSLPAQQALKKLVIAPAQSFPSCKLDNQCPSIAKFEGSTIWNEIFWKGFVKLRHRKLTWRSPVHEAFVMTQAQIDTDISRSTLLNNNLLERIESLEVAFEGPMSAKTFAECAEELISLSVYSANSELIPLLNTIIEHGQRDATLMMLKRVAKKSQQQWIRKLIELTKLPSSSFNKCLIKTMIQGVSDDIKKVPTDNHTTEKQNSMNYQDFRILLAEGKVRASSDQGEESEPFYLDTNEIALALTLIEKNQTNSTMLKAVGGKLHKAIFSANILSLFSATKAAAATRDKSIRIRLVFDEPKYAGLPWEFLYDERTDNFLANNIQTVLSRYIDIPLKKKEIKAVTLPLKVIVVISSPLDGSVAKKIWRSNKSPSTC